MIAIIYGPHMQLIVIASLAMQLRPILKLIYKPKTIRLGSRSICIFPSWSSYSYHYTWEINVPLIIIQHLDTIL